MASIFLLILLSPWTSDCTYNKKDVKKVLSFLSIELKDNFQILKNESGGFKDYYETFTLNISDNDFKLISQKLKTSKNFKGLFTDYNNMPSSNYKIYDTVDFETPNHFQREYFSSRKMENGTFHFIIQLDKQDKKLNYI